MSEDNYGDFLGRLDTATKSLTVRRNLLNTTIEIVILLRKPNNIGLELWQDRSSRVGQLLDVNKQQPDRLDALSELHEVALKMESIFRGRTQRIAEKLTVLEERRDQTSKALRDLERSRVKLTSSRMLAQERESLSQAVAGLAGTSEGASSPFPDPGLLDDLREARHAIVLAEALIEVKGT